VTRSGTTLHANYSLVNSSTVIFQKSSISGVFHGNRLCLSQKSNEGTAHEHRCLCAVRFG
jgi:hypothetical protein